MSHNGNKKFQNNVLFHLFDTFQHSPIPITIQIYFRHAFDVSTTFFGVEWLGKTMYIFFCESVYTSGQVDVGGNSDEICIRNSILSPIWLAVDARFFSLAKTAFAIEYSFKNAQKQTKKNHLNASKIGNWKFRK